MNAVASGAMGDVFPIQPTMTPLSLIAVALLSGPAIP
jgi:hypothetical protein